MLTHFIHTTALWSKYNYYSPHFRDEETEAEVGNLFNITQLVSDGIMFKLGLSGSKYVLSSTR